jgi:hypothetical protein
MFDRLLSTFIICFVLVLCNTAQGIVVTDLYSTKVQINSDSPKDRDKALPSAFATMLIKVTGNSKITTIPQIKKILKNADHYVQAFNYLSTTQTQGQSKLLLNTHFNKLAVNDLLHHTKQTVWGENRPLTLIWLTVQKDDGEKLIWHDGKNTIVTTLTEIASERGLPILLPLLDLSILQQMSASDVSNMREGIIRQVSERYAPDEILIGCVDATKETNITGYWKLFSSKKDSSYSSWETKGHTTETVIQSAINHVVDLLAKGGSTDFKPQHHTIELEITQLDNIDDYAQLIHYLNSLKGVSKIEVLHIAKTTVNVRLTLSINLLTLKRTIQLGSMLTLLETQADHVHNEVLHYALNKQESLATTRGTTYGVSNTFNTQPV